MYEQNTINTRNFSKTCKKQNVYLYGLGKDKESYKHQKQAINKSSHHFSSTIPENEKYINLLKVGLPPAADGVPWSLFSQE